MSTYYPVLRAKRAEWRALASIPIEARRFVMPIVEVAPGFLERKAKLAVRRRDKSEFMAVAELSRAIREQGLRGSLAVDASLLSGSTKMSAETFWKELNRRVPFDVPMIPVLTSTLTAGALGEATRRCSANNLGAVLRVSVSDLNHRGLSSLDSRLRAVSMIPELVDVVVDLKNQPTRFSHSELLELLQVLGPWRSWCVCAGVFPVDLTQFKLPQQMHDWPRDEWTTWVTQVQEAKSGLAPNYGDYTIQNAFPFQMKAVPSVSVRYTLDDRWLVLRGYKPDEEHGRDQYFGHAMMICDDKRYYGREFSMGDEFIYKRAKEEASAGEAGDWLAAGISHHIHVVLQQLGLFAFGDRRVLSAGAQAD